MPRYIDADELKELIDGGFDIDFDEVPETKKALLNMIDYQETADVVERKVGEWIDEPVYKQTMDGKTWDGYTYCSECKEMHEYGYRSKFCPDCGAQMGERREDDD